MRLSSTLEMEGRDKQLKCQALACACIDQDVSALTRLLLDPVYLELVNHRGLGGNSPIHIAVLSKNLPVLSLLLSVGADRSKRNINGDMPIHCACRVGFVDGLKLLCSFPRIVTDAENDAGYLPMDIATSTEVDSMRDSDIYGVFTVGDSAVHSSFLFDLDGRRKCAEYLKSVIERQQKDRLNDYFNETVEINKNKQKVTNILRDSNIGRSKIFYANYQKPPLNSPDHWNERDYFHLLSDKSLFQKMIIKVTSACLVSAVSASTILAFNEKKAIEHQLWLYSRRKQIAEDESGHKVLKRSGFSKTREFFKTPVAESGKRDDLAEFDYTSYDIDDIMSDEEAEYFDATEDMVTDMLLFAMQSKQFSPGGSSLNVSTEFVGDILKQGLQNFNSRILSEKIDSRPSFSEFSINFVNEIISDGLNRSLKDKTAVAISFSNGIVETALLAAIERETKSDDLLEKHVEAVSKAFVNGILSRTPLLDSMRDIPEIPIASFSEKIVNQILTDGIRNYSKESKEVKSLFPTCKAEDDSIALAEQFIEDTLQKLSIEDESTDEFNITKFAKLFVAELLSLKKDSNSHNESSYISDFAPYFVETVIESAMGIKQDPSQYHLETPLQHSIASRELESLRTSMANEFVKMVISAGLNEYAGGMSAQEQEENISEIMAAFRPNFVREQATVDGDRGDSISNILSTQFVKDVLEAGVLALSQVIDTIHVNKEESKQEQGIRSTLDEEIILFQSSNELNVLVNEFVSSIVLQGMARLRVEGRVLLTHNKRHYSNFADSFVINLFTQGLQANIERMSRAPESDERETIFVTSK